ncbi:MAG: hypothetical protein AAFV97_01345 [Bacteroidota bacterium]
MNTQNLKELFLILPFALFLQSCNANSDISPAGEPEVGQPTVAQYVPETQGSGMPEASSSSSTTAETSLASYGQAVAASSHMTTQEQAELAMLRGFIDQFKAWDTIRHDNTLGAYLESYKMWSHFPTKNEAHRRSLLNEYFYSFYDKIMPLGISMDSREHLLVGALSYVVSNIDPIIFQSKDVHPCLRLAQGLFEQIVTQCEGRLTAQVRRDHAPALEVIFRLLLIIQETVPNSFHLLPHYNYYFQQIQDQRVQMAHEDQCQW